VDPDDDGDGIVDFYETATGTFVSPTNTGTDPLDPDTDGDGRNDGDEVAAGTDPNIPNAEYLPALGLWGRTLLLLVSAGTAARGLTLRRRRG